MTILDCRGGGPQCNHRILYNIVVPNLFGTRDKFHGRQFFHRPGVGAREWFRDDSSAWHLLCTLFLLLLHQLHLRSLGIRSQSLRTPSIRGWQGTFLAVQWLRPQASSEGSAGSIPGWGSKILHASGHSQKKKGRFVCRCSSCDDDSNNLESWEEEATRPGMQCWFLQEKPAP